MWPEGLILPSFVLGETGSVGTRTQEGRDTKEEEVVEEEQEEVETRNKILRIEK